MFNLTTSERRAILITVLVITVGGGIEFFKPHINKNYHIDYSELDSVFVRKSNDNTFQLIELENGKNNYKLVRNEKLRQYYFDSPIDTDSSDLQTAYININNATHNELQKLPRIGPALAQRIIDYRKTYGRFRSLEELMNVKGIGEAKYAAMKEYIMVGSQDE